LDQSHHLLGRLSCKSACETLDAVSTQCAVWFCSQYCIWKKSHRGRHNDYVTLLILHASDVHQQQHTFNRSRVATLL